MVLYEYPFNESIRTLLRLEHLFDRLARLIEREAALDHHYALATLFEILDVAARADLKSDLLKELDKHRTQLLPYRGNPAVEQDKLEAVVARIEGSFERLNAMSGKTGARLNSDEWLMSLRSRINIPGGTFEFDLPAYHHWQQQPAGRRQRDLMQWVQCLMPLAEGLSVLLGLIRDSGTPQKIAVAQGQYQQQLSANRVYQLLRLRIDPSLGLIPEISCHRLRVAVRLMRQSEDGLLKLALEDTSFELTLCT